MTSQHRTSRTPQHPDILHAAADDDVFYPESDGQPMGESGAHVWELMRCLAILWVRFLSDPLVFIAGNMFLYYERGNPRAVVAPDLFVVKGVSKLPFRMSYRLWVEGVVPCFVLELTSRSTRLEDVRKAELYARLGVAEYWRFDPSDEPDNEHPVLYGFHLGADGYEPIAPEPDGSMFSPELGLRIRADGRHLRWYDAATGEELQDPKDRVVVAEQLAAAAEQLAAAAEQRAMAEQERAAAAERQAAAAEQRATTERARAEAEALARDAEAQARREAEARVAELEALLRERNRPA